MASSVSSDRTAASGSIARVIFRIWQNHYHHAGRAFSTVLPVDFVFAKFFF
jgi:hypothetical protein